MTYEEMIKKAQSYKMRGKPKNDEHRIQSACVRWFRLKYPKLKNVLFAVPNGGRRDAITGARLKEEGATSGVSDLILLKSNRFYGGLCIESPPVSCTKGMAEGCGSQRSEIRRL